IFSRDWSSDVCSSDLRSTEPSPTCMSTSEIRARIFPLSRQPVALITNSRFSATVRSENSWKSWKIIPSFLRNSGTSEGRMSRIENPATTISPSRSGKSAYKVFSNDDFPEPVLPTRKTRSEEHTSELQSRENLVCRLLLEKK